MRSAQAGEESRREGKRAGRKIKRRAALKCVSPAKMIHPIVPITPEPQ